MKRKGNSFPETALRRDQCRTASPCFSEPKHGTWVSIGVVAAVFCCLQAARADDAFYAQSAPLAIHKVAQNAASVPCYGKLELTLDLSATYTNPFDPSQIDVGAEFTGPTGRVFDVNGFLYQDFSRRLVDGREQLAATGAPVWKIRFAPNVTGQWRYQAYAHDRSGLVRTTPATFGVTPSSNPGFVRVCPRNHAVFAFDSGRAFIPVGEDMCWGNDPQTYSYDRWMPRLHAAGGNWVRLWMSPGNNGIEWSPWGIGNAGDFHGLGVYNLAAAWRLDKTLDIAEANGIYVMVCFGTYGELTTGGYFHEGMWDSNPYNRALGGPCAAPGDIWTDPTARRYYRQRLRYIAARYGYRTCIQSWELWNEADAPTPWVAEMASFLKGTPSRRGFPPADPYGHLITTTYGNSDVWKLPGIDWTESHIYGTGDRPEMAQEIAGDAHDNAVYGKPHLTAEFGIDWRKPDSAYDPAGSGTNLHNALWASIMSGSAGGAMNWWWDSYIDPANLYHEFTPFATFATGIDWTSGPWTPLQTTAVITDARPETFGDLILPASDAWGKAPISDFSIPPGRGDAFATYPGYLYSPGKADMRTLPTFHVAYPLAGQFIVHVDSVSNAATIEMSVDGVVSARYSLDASPPATAGDQPGYESTEYEPEWKIYKALYDKDYAVDVPAGRHTVQIAVVDGDWASVDSFRLTHYTSNRYANAVAVGLSRGRTAILWILNRDHNWKTVLDNTPIHTIHSPSTRLLGLPPGVYIVRWFDTEVGKTIRVDRVAADKHGLTIVAPNLRTDIAATIIPAG